MTSNFTISHYEKTIKSYIDYGYLFCEMGKENKNSDSHKIIMFHDVDHDISLCKNFLNVEKSLNIGATYFLRLHARSYNMLSRQSKAIAEHILDSGGDIGLHYEPSFCPLDKLDYAQHIQEEMEILSTAIGREVHLFNLHEPARTGVDLSSLNAKQNRCYNSSFFKDYKYLSDSSCRWREGCFSEHLGKWSKILVLTHPIWWYNNCPAENY
tara:strand:+ start:2095 stop:2727 length:633 start_codon:yes stop_codon:yes gene_type:complete